jgi:hypothetical protein
MLMIVIDLVNDDDDDKYDDDDIYDDTDGLSRIMGKMMRTDLYGKL